MLGGGGVHGGHPAGRVRLLNHREGRVETVWEVLHGGSTSVGRTEPAARFVLGLGLGMVTSASRPDSSLLANRAGAARVRDASPRVRGNRRDRWRAATADPVTTVSAEAWPPRVSEFGNTESQRVITPGGARGRRQAREGGRPAGRAS